MIIGVTQRCLPPTEHGESRDALDVRWPPFLAACGIAPVPLPNVPGLAVTIAETVGVQGILLTGGDNLAAYGGPFPQRDKTETGLLGWALVTGTPLLGVCRGMQLLVHALGGTLTEVDGHVATRHEMRTQDGVREVNSYHRIAPVVVPSPLEVTGMCGDVVEAVRHRDAAVAGLMWHPEREEPFAGVDIAVFRDFFGGLS
jgi:N5-(cytidine 5'-diphosphoramidyl)-L-glutamine hydrolase